MRDADLDWCCYTFLSRRNGATLEELTEAVGVTREAVDASLVRLERALLIGRDGDRVRPMSIQESFLACQVRYTDNLPFVLENGVVRARRADDA